MTLDNKKPWYMSKTIWVATGTIIVAIYNLLGKMGLSLPLIPEEIYIILAALGIKYRMSATTTLGKK